MRATRYASSYPNADTASLQRTGADTAALQSTPHPISFVIYKNVSKAYKLRETGEAGKRKRGMDESGRRSKRERQVALGMKKEARQGAKKCAKRKAQRLLAHERFTLIMNHTESFETTAEHARHTRHAAVMLP